ncbi:hypothetical protein CA264_05875 [Pontibacter actiniarum]|uniref:Lipoprotein n=1 Tax=Pontibacter actiniarum TaxID=323450 RepID=A0A1X9YQ28_9BACT|nr:hypothetical protein CA264_05875 [Pontibacter actiniarum]
MERTQQLTLEHFSRAFTNLATSCFCIFMLAACSGENNTSVIDKVNPEERETEEIVAEEGAKLETRSTEELGAYLTDASGRSLYMFEADSSAQSNCYDACAEAWPPYTTEGTAEAGVGVDAALVGAIQRTDGRMQVTYNGMPLYYYVKDSGAGQTTGQDIEDYGAEWYLVTPSGEKVHAESGS